MNSIQELTEQVNFQIDIEIIVIRAYDKKGEWHIEVVSEDGIKATRPTGADEVNAIEIRLGELGWQIDPSLFHRGFNAKPKVKGLCVSCQLGNHCGSCSCCAGDEYGFIFASGIEWPEAEYGLESYV